MSEHSVLAKDSKGSKKGNKKSGSRDNVQQTAEGVMSSDSERRNAGKRKQNGRNAASSRDLGADAKEERETKVLSAMEYPSLTAELIKKLCEKAGYDCMICYEGVDKKDPIWSCGRCFAIFHLNCVTEWSKISVVESSSSRNRNSELSSSNSQPIWRCPACQLPMSKSKIPKQYRCFCEKKIRPEYDPYLTPHSCGDPCDKKKGPGCPHKCTLPCHPGPCPPCTAPGPEKRCPCKRTKFRLKCGERVDKKNPRTCNSICRKLLSCKIHTCLERCHAGDCPPCSRKEIQKCFCGSCSEEKDCGTGIWNDKDLERHYSCHNICGKLLECGSHSCSKVCHPGDCGPCTRTPVSPTRCACGKSLVDIPKRQSCQDPLPVCSQICDRVLDCMVHSCEDTCHDSPCKPCNKFIDLPCRCGRSIVHMSCRDLIHARENQTVNQTAENLILCKKVCKSMLSCGQHRCNRRCCVGVGLDEEHRPIHRCHRICGKLLPCGKHKCGDFCHLGFCSPCGIMNLNGISCRCGSSKILEPVPCGVLPPPCNQPCSVQRECGHPCVYPCHEGPCPPCVVLTDKPCVGGHQLMSNRPCHLPLVSCGQVCGKLRECQIHSCRRKCHSDPCRGNIAGAENLCGQVCLLQRECGHPCRSSCHGSSPCPPLKCSELVTVWCKCRRRSEKLFCGRGVDAGDDSVDPISDLPCDDLCEIEKRNKALADALQISADHKKIPYTQRALELSLHDMEFVCRSEKNLERFLRNPDPSVGRCYLPPMPSSRRQLIHELAAQFGMISEAMDDRKRRFIRLLRLPTSHLPFILLSKASELYKNDPSSINSRATESTSTLLVIYARERVTGLEEFVSNFLFSYEGKYVVERVIQDETMSDFVILSTQSEAIAKTISSFVSQHSRGILCAAIIPFDVSVEDMIADIQKDVLHSRLCELKVKEPSDPDGWEEVPRSNRLNNQNSSNGIKAKNSYEVLNSSDVTQPVVDTPEHWDSDED